MAKPSEAPARSFWTWKKGKRVRRRFKPGHTDSGQVAKLPSTMFESPDSVTAVSKIPLEEHGEESDVVVEYAPRLQLVYGRSHRKGPGVYPAPRLGAKYHPVPRGAHIPRRRHWSTTAKLPVAHKPKGTAGKNDDNDDNSWPDDCVMDGVLHVGARGGAASLRYGVPAMAEPVQKINPMFERICRWCWL